MTTAVVQDALIGLRGYHREGLHRPCCGRLITQVDVLYACRSAIAMASGDTKQVANIRNDFFTDCAVRKNARDVAATDTVVDATNSECPLVVPDSGRHRYHMSEAAVEVGVTVFGRMLPTAGWSCFEAMLASMLALHVCRLENLGEIPPDVDPLWGVKSWIRKHTRDVDRKVNATTSDVLATDVDACRAMQSLAESAMRGEQSQTCSVMLRTTSRGAFADLFVGAVRRGTGVTDWLTIKLTFPATGTGVCDDEGHDDASFVRRVVTWRQMRQGTDVPVSEGSRTITASNQADAFYPTGWGKELFPAPIVVTRPTFRRIV